MSIPVFNVTRNVQSVIKDLVSDRLDKEEPIEYQDTRDGMLQLHCNWQDLMSSIKKHDKNLASREAIRLAAAAIKFASDLGEEVILSNKKSKTKIAV